jgi:hypothetical protein
MELSYIQEDMFIVFVFVSVFVWTLVAAGDWNDPL